MSQLSTLNLPISATALRLLAAEAKANGVTVEEQAACLLEDGFGVSAGHVIECLLADARSAAADAGAATLTLPDKQDAKSATAYTKAGHCSGEAKAA